MRSVHLDGTDLTVSRFIFGTASLHHVRGAGARGNLLEAAVNAGFSHFDTAPLYGFGLAERDLAPLLKRHPALTVTTKVGLYAPGGTRQGAVSVFSRKAAGRLLPALSRAVVDFSLARAKQSLEGSLRRLGRETIDIYTLHEPDPLLIDFPEWHRWLEDIRAAGKVRYYGIAVDAKRAAAITATSKADFPIIQAQDSVAGREADVFHPLGRKAQITYGYLSSALARGAAIDIPAEIHGAMMRNPDGAIVVSTRRVERLALYTKLANQNAA